MSLEIDPIINETQINIILDTNIPGEQFVSFTKNIIYNQLLNDTSGFSEYPYFSSVIPYPQEILKGLDYVNQVAFFFKKENFIKILKETSEYKTILEEKEKNEKEKNELLKRKINGESNIEFDIDKFEFKINDTDKKNNIKNNIMLMLYLIFPTNYPTYNNIMNSYDTIFSGIMKMTSSSLSSIIPFLLSISLGIKSTKQKYSYIKTPSKGICTVIQVIWLNDLYNHPEYKKIISEYIKFQEWKIIESYKKEKELKSEYTKFQKKYSTGLQKLNESLKKISNPTKRFEQTYYGYADKNYLKEYEFIKETIPQILNFGNIEDTINNLIKFKFSFNILKVKLGKELQDIRKDFNEEQIIGDINKLEMINEIVNVYLNKKELKVENDKSKEDYQYKMTDYDKESENLKNRIKNEWKDYNKYTEFIKLIQTFIRPNNESSNNSLQDLIENFIKGEDEDREFEKILSKSNTNSSKIETGITIKSNDPIKNVIYVRMDVIAGEINDKNKNSINCIFNGEYLGNELMRLTKPSKKTFELEKDRFFFDLNSKSSKDVKKDDLINETNTQLKTNGGKKNRTKKRFYK